MTGVVQGGARFCRCGVLSVPLSEPSGVVTVAGVAGDLGEVSGSVAALGAVGGELTGVGLAAAVCVVLEVLAIAVSVVAADAVGGVFVEESTSTAAEKAVPAGGVASGRHARPNSEDGRSTGRNISFSKRECRKAARTARLLARCRLFHELEHPEEHRRSLPFVQDSTR